MKKYLTIKVYYDSWCPLCIKITNRIRKLDWFNLIEFISIREIQENEVQIPLDDLEKSMHSIRKQDHKVFKGIDAISSMIIRLPMLFPAWVPLKVLSILGLGNILYNNIASKRKIVPVGNCDSETGCKL